MARDNRLSDVTCRKCRKTRRESGEMPYLKGLCEEERKNWLETEEVNLYSITSDVTRKEKASRKRVNSYYLWKVYNLCRLH